ncbi:diaminopimelate epimerase [Chelatococcus reniformis]|uniref:Diaminopimelate epimerase n=1 Tax=Chelatococcus reniformis TaxID=1494448 RepID=A0A916TY66_9HYPH|nr:diaminopimelate epimerase [Chelatococcus reniformis]GGC49706.1 diaminopimelate epimerase [Chelatococcus reniformis]
MSALDDHAFLKMNGLGNEIVILDLRGSAHVVTPAEARAIAGGSDSHFDQLMVLHDPVTSRAAAFMRIYNSDGSDSAACGNGTRCVAWALAREGAPDELVLETASGALASSRIAPELFTVDMGEPRFDWREIPLARDVGDTSLFDLEVPGWPGLGRASAVSMGNPHLIFFIRDPMSYHFDTLGPLLERHPLFPERVNVSFAEVMSPTHVDLRVWERGAGPTKACGTAACATAVAAARRGLTEREATITLPGGDLDIFWRESDRHVLMTGPVELEWEGRLPASLLRQRESVEE